MLNIVDLDRYLPHHCCLIFVFHHSHPCMKWRIHSDSISDSLSPYKTTTETAPTTEDVIAPALVASFQKAAAMIGANPPATKIAKAKRIILKIPVITKAKTTPKTPIISMNIREIKRSFFSSS